MKALLKINTERSTFKMLPKELHEDLRPKLSSAFKPNGSKDILRGLSPEQEASFLPAILGIPVTDINFNREVLDYWKNWNCSVPIKGKVLNIESKFVSTGEGKDKKTVENPENLEDYIAYNMAKQHPDVANTQERLDNHEFYYFTLTNLEEEKKKEEEVYKEKEDALKSFLIMTAESEANAEKIDWIVNLYLTKDEDRPVTLLEKKVFLNKKLDKDPKKFNTVMSDPDLELKSLIIKLIDAQILSKEGNSIFYMEESFGTLKEAIAYLKMAQHSKTLQVLKEKLREKIK